MNTPRPPPLIDPPTTLITQINLFTLISIVLELIIFNCFNLALIPLHNNQTLLSYQEPTTNQSIDAYFTNQEPTSNHSIHMYFTNQEPTSNHSIHMYFTNQEPTTNHSIHMYFTNQEPTTIHYPYVFCNSGTHH